MSIIDHAPVTLATIQPLQPQPLLQQQQQLQQQPLQPQAQPLAQPLAQLQAQPQPPQSLTVAVPPKPKKPSNSAPGSLPPKRRRKNAAGETPLSPGPRKQVGQKGWIWPFWTPLVDTRPGYSKCKFCQGELSHCNPTRLKDHLLKKCKEFLTHEDAARLAETEMEVKEAMLRADSQGRLTSCSSAVSPRNRREKKKEAAPAIEYLDGLVSELPVDAFHEQLNLVEQCGKRLVQLLDRTRHLAYEKEESEKARVEASAAADLAALHAKVAKNATAFAKLMQAHHELEQQLFTERDEGRKLERDLQEVRDENHKLDVELQDARGRLIILQEENGKLLVQQQQQHQQQLQHQQLQQQHQQLQQQQQQLGDDMGEKQ